MLFLLKQNMPTLAQREKREVQKIKNKSVARYKFSSFFQIIFNKHFSRKISKTEVYSTAVKSHSYKRLFRYKAALIVQSPSPPM